MYYILLTVVIILLITFVFKINKKEFYKWKKNFEFAISLPGASIFSSIVNSLQIACNYKELINYVEATTKKYGSLTRILIGTDIFVVLSKPEDYRVVLTNVHGNYKTSVTKTWETFLGNGIIRTSGAVHRLRRKIIQPLLNLKHLFEYVSFFDSYSNLCADTLEKNVNGEIFDLKPYIARYSFDIFLVSATGIQELSHKYKYDELKCWQKELIDNGYSRKIKPWLQLEWIFSLAKSKKQTRIAQKNVLDFIYTISPLNAATHTALQDNNEIFQKSIFNNYLNRVEKLRYNVTNKSCDVSDENIIDDLLNFFIIITNTITEMTSFFMLMLAMHTEVQEKLREEIFVTFGNNKVDAEHLQSMRYFYMVYQEILRMFPIASFIIRQLTGDIKLESCTLPEGCYVMIPIFAIHRNPAYWHKPLEFIPERFASESSSSRPQYTYIPFGMGFKDCLGQKYTFLSVATIIVNLVRRYRFINTNNNKDDIKVTYDVMLRTADAKLSISRI